MSGTSSPNSGLTRRSFLKATGAAAAATGRAAGAMAAGAGTVVRQGYGAVKTAAYKLAALRGRA